MISDTNEVSLFIVECWHRYQEHRTIGIFKTQQEAIDFIEEFKVKGSDFDNIEWEEISSGYAYRPWLEQDEGA